MTKRPGALGGQPSASELADAAATRILERAAAEETQRTALEPPPVPQHAQRGTKARVVRSTPAEAGAPSLAGFPRAPDRAPVMLNREEPSDTKPVIELMLVISRGADGRFRLVLLERDYLDPSKTIAPKTRGWGSLRQCVQEVSRAMPEITDFMRRRLNGVKPVLG